MADSSRSFASAGLNCSGLVQPLPRPRISHNRERDDPRLCNRSRLAHRDRLGTER